jgi:hypothetical protein
MNLLSRTDFPVAAARQYIAMTRDALDPIMSLRLIMEAAASMAKVDPDTVRQTPFIRRRARWGRGPCRPLRFAQRLLSCVRRYRGAVERRCCASLPNLSKSN